MTWTPTTELNGRAILLPDVRDFGDLLEYVAEWDHETMSGYAGKPPMIAGKDLGERAIGENVISPFTTINTPLSKHRAIAARATDVALAAVAPRIVTPDDRLSWRVIEHVGTGRALVILEHGYIIGSHWVAYIDAATIAMPNGEPRRAGIERHRNNLHPVPMPWCPACQRIAELEPETDTAAIVAECVGA